MLPMSFPVHLKCDHLGTQRRCPGRAISTHVTFLPSSCHIGSNTRGYTFHKCKVGGNNKKSQPPQNTFLLPVGLWALGPLLGLSLEALWYMLLLRTSQNVLTSVSFKSHLGHTLLAFVPSHSHSFAIPRAST